MPLDEDSTLIAVKKTTAAELKKLGDMSDTYDDVISRLIKKENKGR
jgi:hypothetical protein